MASKFNQRAVGNKVRAQQERSRWGKGYSNDPVGKAYKPNGYVAKREMEEKTGKTEG